MCLGERMFQYAADDAEREDSSGLDQGPLEVNAVGSRTAYVQPSGQPDSPDKEQRKRQRKRDLERDFRSKKGCVQVFCMD